MGQPAQDTPEHQAAGRAAYDAYGVVVGHRNYAGHPMPAWDDLPGIIRVAWEAAASAVLERERGRG